MNTPTVCPLESRVVAAAASGAWGDELTAHLASCGACADATRVGAFLAAGAAALEASAPLAGADAVLRRAARRDHERRLARTQLPIRLAQGFAGLAGASAATFAAVRVGPAIGAWLAGLSPPAIAVPPSPASSLVVLGALTLSALVIGIFTSWQAVE